MRKNVDYEQTIYREISIFNKYIMPIYMIFFSVCAVLTYLLNLFVASKPLMYIPIMVGFAGVIILKIMFLNNSFIKEVKKFEKIASFFRSTKVLVDNRYMKKYFALWTLVTVAFLYVIKDITILLGL